MSEPCEHCGKERVFMFAMKPGPDGAPWKLCSRCWLDGLRSMNDTSDQAVIAQEAPAVATPVAADPPPREKKRAPRKKTA